MSTIISGYGRIGSGTYKLDEHVISIKGVGERNILYTRALDKDVVCEQVIVGSTELVLIPMYPVLIPKNITNYILVELDRKTSIAPGSETNFYIKIPVDIAVYAYYGREYTMIDIIPCSKPKYVLYGTPSEGVIARYTRSRVYMEEPEPEKGKALVSIRVRNKTREWTVLTKILMDASNLRLHYTNGSWRACVQEIEVSIDSLTTATVSYGEVPWRGLKAIDDPPGLKPPRIMFRTDMMWGI